MHEEQQPERCHLDFFRWLCNPGRIADRPAKPFVQAGDKIIKAPISGVRYLFPRRKR